MFNLFKRKQKFFTDDENHLIVKAIRHAEEQTSGEVRVYVESKCRFMDAIDRAAELFYKLKMDRTEQRNATIVYVAVNDRQLAVFGMGLAVIRFTGLALFNVALARLHIRISGILADILVIIGYIGWGFFRLNQAGVELTHLFATSAILTAVLAISMQDTLGNLLTRIMQGCAGYWYLDRAGVLTFAQYPLPASGGVTYDEKSLIDRATVDESDRLYKTIQYQYRTNWTTQSQLRPAATAGQAAFAASNGLLGNTTQTAVPEYTYTDSPLLPTLFDSSTDAATVAGRLQTLYGTPRKLITATVPYTSTLKLGDAVTLAWFGTSCDGAVIALADVFNGQYPQQKITVVA